MHFRQFYLGCLAHASYLLGSNGEAAVVDPQRDVDIYLEEAETHGLKIRYIIETHMHADFVSGHRELAERTGAEIYTGSAAQAAFPHHAVRDGEELTLGAARLRFLETPGHSLDSLCVLVYDENSALEPIAVLTGDTLFIGDVGRPDLMGAVATPEELAGRLYDSLHLKLLTLPDTVKVFPAHGAGSLCGRNISAERSSTIGLERLRNYALQPMSRDNFIQVVTANLPPAPAYFPRDQRLNRQGAVPLTDLPKLPALGPEQVSELGQQGHLLLDTRNYLQFGAGHVPGSMNIGLDGQYASWAGAMIGLDTPIVLIAEDEARINVSRTRLARVGIENVAGYLTGGAEAWSASGRALQQLEQISVEELQSRIAASSGKLQVLDVRRPAEWESGHISTARHVPLMELRSRIAELDQLRPLSVICGGGYRSSIATSLLMQQGFQSLSNVVGGMTAWCTAQLPTVS